MIFAERLLNLMIDPSLPLLFHVASIASVRCVRREACRHQL